MVDRDSRWDHVQALDSVGGDVQFLNELAGIFCAASPPLLKRLEESIAAQSRDQTSDAAHLLRSLARSLAATSVEQAAATVEALVLHNDFEDLESACNALRQAVEQLAEELTKFRSGKYASNEGASGR